MSEVHLVESVAQIGDAPCDTCPLWDVCKTDQLACPEFWWWANSPKPDSNGAKVFGKPIAEMTDFERAYPVREGYEDLFNDAF